VPRLAYNGDVAAAAFGSKTNMDLRRNDNTGYPGLSSVSITELITLTEAFDMTTPTGRAMAGMLAFFAEFEREILRERVKAGIAQARSKGKTVGRPVSRNQQGG
jgi:hypothetical protein